MRNRFSELSSEGATPFRARRTIGFAFFVVALAAEIFAQGCGYHVSGHSANLPSEWTTVAVPAFKNDTTRYRIEQRFTEATIREFITRTKYHVVQDTSSADAVLHGEVLSIETTPVLFNATTGEVTTMLVTVHTKVDLIDNHTQKPVYEDNDMVFRDEYQISTDVNSFFEEQDPALERMSRDLASHIVANVLEGF
ncbi:MAG TPA: LptE family protein [Candidatus Aquilonibacter sp.]|nr:LptE family protein [Candidatus Aquilonibacter sp.]